MKITTIGLAVVALALAVSMSASAQGRTYHGFNVGTSNAPPPPRVAYTSQPKMHKMPGSRVSVLSEQDPGYDMFHYGSSYYVSDGDHWYRGQSYKGPYASVDARKVPRQVYNVPAEHWRHGRHDGSQMNQGHGQGQSH
jgi:hypothetical protein